jgi:hypothetical protein
MMEGGAMRDHSGFAGLRASYHSGFAGLRASYCTIALVER